MKYIINSVTKQKIQKVQSVEEKEENGQSIDNLIKAHVVKLAT